MNLAHHYQTLGLRPGSPVGEVKAAYRQLVRRYHPDVNPNKQAVEHFIKINDAYTAISDAKQVSHQKSSAYRAQTPAPATSFNTTPFNLEKFNLESLKRQLEKLGIGNLSDPHQMPPSKPGAVTACPESGPSRQHKSSTQGQETPSVVTPLSSAEQDWEADLKQEAYLQLRALLKQKKYPRAIALVEGLAHRMSTDAEISQWQAIVYQRWGRQLIRQGQTQKAQIYLNKALRTDPNNSLLWREVNRDFWQLASLGSALENDLENNLGNPSNPTR